MELDKITLFNVVKKRLAWLGQRQEVISQNIANADTPDYQARDLKPFRFKDLVRAEQNPPLRMEVTQRSHLPGRRRRATDFAATEERKPFETSPSGNSVVLEEQMAKMSESGISHRLTTELYKKHLAMIRMAVGNRR
ncbi:MAG: flagellar basal body rod protein FlgB [Rhodospirillales bacterium]